MELNSFLCCNCSPSRRLEEFQDTVALTNGHFAFASRLRPATAPLRGRYAKVTGYGTGCKVRLRGLHRPFGRLQATAPVQV